MRHRGGLLSTCDGEPTRAEAARSGLSPRMCIGEGASENGHWSTARSRERAKSASLRASPETPQSMAKSNLPIRIPYLVYERCRSATTITVPAWQKNSKLNSRAVIYSQREMQGSVCVALLYGVCRPAPPRPGVHGATGATEFGPTARTSDGDRAW